MSTVTLQGVIDANTEAILTFLETEIRSIQPCKPPAEGKQVMIDIQREDQGNVISMYKRACETGQDGIIRFEVVPHTKTMSTIKAFYEGHDHQFILAFYRTWAKLAIAFAATFAGEALKALHELEDSTS